jgi:DNA-binding response OmpR family regulator
MPIPIPSEFGTEGKVNERLVRLLKVLVITNSGRVDRDIAFCLQIRYPEVTVDSVGDGTAAIGMIVTESPDLIVVDSSLSETDIIDLVGAIRNSSRAPLFVVYETATDVRRAEWLEAGADDCIAMPFSPIELLARCNAVIRRTKGSLSAAASVSFGQTNTDPGMRVVTHAGEPVSLTPIEHRLLSELTRNGDLTVSSDDLLTRVWGPEYRGDPSLVKTYIYRLRSKLRKAFQGDYLIHNERGFGYHLHKKHSMPARRPQAGPMFSIGLVLISFVSVSF